MDFVFEKGGIFIPEIADNNAKPDAEKIRVHWRFPNNEERNDIWTNREGHVYVNKSSLIKCCITKIENVKLNGVDIKTGTELTAAECLYDLHDEIIIFLANKLTTFCKKK